MESEANDFGGIKSRFDRDATVFDDIYSRDAGFNSWFNRTFRKPIFERFDIAMAQMADVRGKTILDIGCGPGAYVLSLASRGAKRVLGVDLSPAMIEIANRRLRARRMDDACELRTANFLDVSFDEKFDFSLAMGVFDYLRAPVPFLHKMRDVTREAAIASFPGHSPLREPLRKLRYFSTGRGGVYFYSRDDVQRLVEAVGFRSYEIVPIRTGSGFVLVARP
jgi:SAM-dependent methyltransferase